MLTPYQKGLLLQLEREIDESLENSPRLNALLRRLRRDDGSSDKVEQSDQLLEEAANEVPANAPVLSDEDISRESIYADDDEEQHLETLVREGIESGPATEMTKEDFEGIRREMHAKHSRKDK